MLTPLLQRLRRGADQAEIGEFLRYELEDHFGLTPLPSEPETHPSSIRAGNDGCQSDLLVDSCRPDRWHRLRVDTPFGSSARCPGVPLTDAQWADRAVTSGADTEAGWPVARPPRGDRRHRLEVPDRGTVGAAAGEIRHLAGRPQPAAGVVRRRHVGAGAHRACGTRRRRGAELGRIGGLHNRASPSARGRSPHKRPRPASRTTTPSAGAVAD